MHNNRNSLATDHTSKKNYTVVHNAFKGFSSNINNVPSSEMQFSHIIHIPVWRTELFYFSLSCHVSSFRFGYCFSLDPFLSFLCLYLFPFLSPLA